MKRLIEYQLSSGGSLIAEVDEPGPEGGPQHASLRDYLTPQSAHVTFEEALDKVKPAAIAMKDKLSSLQPDRIEVEFGLKMNADVGAILASAGVEANYKITLAWEMMGK